MTRTRRSRAFVIAWLALVVACGARTGLYAPEEAEDAAADVHVPHDATTDPIEEDAQDEDAGDVADVVFPDVPIVSDCPDAGDTLVYVLGAHDELYSFYPPTLSFQSIGTIACPSTSTPNSMAVTRSGIAFANFQSGELFEVSTSNAACKATTYAPDQLGWQTYGMGYVALADGGESLYVAGFGNIFSRGLGVIDTTAFMLSEVGQFQPMQYDCELTGTGDGRLFGYCPFGSGDGSYFIEIDPATANVLSSHQLSAGSNEAWAFAFWGGEFWIFSGKNGVSTVTEYDANSQTETNVATAPIDVVGAGVSTCAPL